MTFDVGLTCQPILCDIDNDGDEDLFFLSNAHLGWMENTGTSQEPFYTLRSYDLVNSLPAGSADLADLDGDGLKDLVTASGWGGTVTLWRCTGIHPNPSFQSWQNFSLGGLAGEVTLGDLDADGDQDLVIGAEISGNFYLLYYQNQGNARQPNFVQVAQSLPGVSFQGLLGSNLVDMDLDGCLDLLIHSNYTTHTSYYHNLGTPQQMNFQLVTDNLVGDSLIGSAVEGADIDADGDVDLFVGDSFGGCRFFRNTTGESQVNPKRPEGPPERMITILPNPGNSGATISYILDHPQRISLDVYNLLGAKVASLASGLQLPGNYSYTWDASAKASGIYILRFTTPDQSLARKITILK